MALGGLGCCGAVGKAVTGATPGHYGPMRFLLAGSSGFLGTALRRHLADAGHEIRQLVRRTPASPEEVQWFPYGVGLPPTALDDVDVVVNLSGAPIGHWPWTSSYKRTLLNSRVATTQTLARALRDVGRSVTLINASAVGYYGDRGDELLTEESTPGDGLLADVVRHWEDATARAREAGQRVVMIRTAVVLDRSGGALKSMLVPFRLGVGGTIGSGRQWFPSISLNDYVRAIRWLAEYGDVDGPVNLAAPEPATNADLTVALGRALRRPTVMSVPAAAVRLALGRDLSGQLLGSLKVQPRRLLDAGFEFEQPDLVSQLNATLPHR